MPGTYVDNAYNRKHGRVGMPRGSMPVSDGVLCSPKTYVDNAYNRSLGRVGLTHGDAVVSKYGYYGWHWSSQFLTDSSDSDPQMLGKAGKALNSKNDSSVHITKDSSLFEHKSKLEERQLRTAESKMDETDKSETFVDNAYNRSLGRAGLPHGTAVVSKYETDESKTYVDNAYNRSQGRVGLPHRTADVSKYETDESKTYVDNAYNRSLGRVGMPHGTAVVSKDETVESKTYVDNAYNRSLGRVGLPHGTAVVSRDETDESKTYVDNAYNRSQGRVGLPHGTAVVSKYETDESKTYVGNAYTRSLARVGLPHGTADVSKYETDESKTYVDNAYNRSLGRVGLPHGTAVVSKDETVASKTYVCNAYTRSLARVGLPHGTADVSKYETDESKTYVDNAYNRSLGRVGLPHGTAVVSKDETDESKTYVDNAYNRKLGRVGLPHGTAVVSKDKTNESKSRVDNTYNCSFERIRQQHGMDVGGFQSSAGSGADFQKLDRVYVDNALNRRLGRVGKALGSMPHSSGNISNISQRYYVNNYLNRCLGRVGLPLGTMVIPNRSQQTDAICKMYHQIKNNPYDDVEIRQLGIAIMELETEDQACETAIDLINRLEHINMWQKKIGTRRQPSTAEQYLQFYKGICIDFNELDLQKKIGHGGFGDVYFAEYNRSVVAVKKLRVQRVRSRCLKEFIRELTAFCELKHPNIVKFIGACVDKPNLAIVMEYMQCSLYEALHIQDDREFSEKDRLSLMRQILAGLVYLHEKEIAHCDMKSLNILLNFEDETLTSCKITDFGLSMMRADNQSSVSGTKRVRKTGTPRYSAPEVLRGMLLNCSEMIRADMYSVSLVIFEVICEVEPFPSLRYNQLCKLVGKGNFTPEIPMDIEISRPILTKMKACWNRVPSDRPTAGAFLSSIESVTRVYAE